MLKPVFAVVTILSTIWDFKVFTQIYLMPGGSGTNRDVLNLGTWSYITAISQNRYGLGAAIAVLLTVLLLVITVVYLRTLFRQDEL
jgi:N,N'-diacetylchitobiose transport system permease protein